MVLDHQEASNELDDSVRVKVREALLKRHHHQNEKKKNLIPIVRSIAEGTRKQSEPHLTGGFHALRRMQTYAAFQAKLLRKSIDLKQLSQIISWYESNVEIQCHGFRL